MHLTIGVQNVSRDITLDVDDADAALRIISDAIESDRPVVVLTDAKGSRILIPTRALGYAHVDPQQNRPVGFGRA